MISLPRSSAFVYKEDFELEVFTGKKPETPPPRTSDFDELEKKFNDFAAKAKVEETASGVSSALSALGEELKKGYERIRSLL